MPGLAENRPSLIRGDDLLVRKPGDKVRYKGYIHSVCETTVQLGFYERYNLFLFLTVIYKMGTNFQIRS